MKNLILCLWVLFSFNLLYAQPMDYVKNSVRMELKVDEKSNKRVKIPSLYHDKEGNLLEPYRNSASNIIVNYDSGFTPEAQAAFQYAVEIWESILTSNVPIQINATWQPDPNPGNLGSAGPAALGLDNDNNIAYPIALANAIVGSDISPLIDIVANFNSARSNWYFGTDGNTPDGMVDLVTVVLHEIGHGIGLFGSAQSDGTAANTTLRFFINGTAYAAIWDTFIENGAGVEILGFPNNSTSLLNQLTSEDLFFNGANANAANGDALVAIYAPENWNPGSSFSHVEYFEFFGTLMIPFLPTSTAIHDPGIIARGILKDLGWQLDCGVEDDLVVNNSGNAIQAGTYVGANTVSTSGTTVAAGTNVVFRAGNSITLMGTPTHPFSVEGEFLALTDGAICHPSTHSLLNEEDNSLTVNEDESVIEREVFNNNESLFSQPQLSQNQPNPFSGETVIAFDIPESAASAQILIADLNGKMVKRIPIDLNGKGNVLVNGEDFREGIYFYFLEIDGVIVKSHKMVVAR